jgi:hypothetical protein
MYGCQFGRQPRMFEEKQVRKRRLDIFRQVAGGAQIPAREQ